MFCKHEVRASCGFVINEVNVIDPSKPEKKEFIEMMSTCEESYVALRGYKLIGINAGKKADSVATIELVITLWNEHISGSKYFTVGGSDITHANLKVPDPKIKFRESFHSGISSITNFISNGNRNLNAIGLLYDRGNSFSEITLTADKNFIRIDANILEILKKYMVDMVVYTKLHDRDRCNIFEEINADLANKKYALREFTSTPGRDITLNRCALELTGFLPEKFKIGKATPGSDNDCTGAHYILEDHILDVIPPVISRHTYPTEYEGEIIDYMYEPECTSSIERTEYFMAREDEILESIANATTESENSVCTPQFLYPDGANTAEIVDRANCRKRQISREVDYSEELEWQTEKYFK